MAEKKKPSKKATKPKKAAKKTAKASKKTLKSLSQVHGKDEKYEATTLDQIWGDTGTTKYGTTDVNEYIRKLDGMNTSDLQTHAHKIGLIPIDDRVTITKKLVYEFKRYVSGYTKPDQISKPNAPVSKSVKKILDEGR